MNVYSIRAHGNYAAGIAIVAARNRAEAIQLAAQIEIYTSREC